MLAARTDCHQHLWPEALVEELRRRSRPPRLDGWELLLEGEAPYAVEPGDHDAAKRHRADADDGVDLVLLSLSSPLGIELLPPEESAPLLAAWHEYADDLPAGRALWAAPRLVEHDPAELARVLARPSVCGLQVPATVMTTPHAVEQLAPVLEVAETADLPVLVHPGPVAAPESEVPGWWAALTSYPAQLTAAWFAWHAAGRSLLPRLRIGFVALAGLAPLHHERLAQRGGSLGEIDPGVFYETSSYGRQAVDAMTRVVGADALVHGTDRPYAGPTDLALGPAFDRAVEVVNPHHFLHGGPR
ncbi:amidohydrolase family protein [Nocardioides sp.]|uniref:amidohydrolase family protein n=1 Tax=Nocardioides sp. TaxID=35761 RepID=UPI002D7FE6BB|nr:amidohydrolase family protein [Nocardioides sp.]HET8959756.1 amidohydrolase family protein [Nocardioides sp.]